MHFNSFVHIILNQYNTWLLCTHFCNSACCRSTGEILCPNRFKCFVQETVLAGRTVQNVLKHCSGPHCSEQYTVHVKLDILRSQGVSIRYTYTFAVYVYFYKPVYRIRISTKACIQDTQVYVYARQISIRCVYVYLVVSMRRPVAHH